MERTLAEPIWLKFGTGINPEHAEGVIWTLGEEDTPTRPVRIQFDGYPYVNAGAGCASVAAPRRYSGGVLEATVPPIGVGDWFRTFSRGWVLRGDSCRKAICDGKDVSVMLRDYYLGPPIRREQNAVCFGDLHLGAGVNPEGEDLFRDAFISSLRKVNVWPANFNRDRLKDVIKFAFEAIQNVYDHARRKPLPEGTKVVSDSARLLQDNRGSSRPDRATKGLRRATLELDGTYED